MGTVGIQRTFQETGFVLTDDHFVLNSGRHSSMYANKDRIYVFTNAVRFLCRQIAQHFADDDVGAVIAPEVGAVVLSHLVADELMSMTTKPVVYATYAERDEEVIYRDIAHDTDFNVGSKDFTILAGEELIRRRQEFVIKRGYDKFIAGMRTVVVEDIITSGATVKKVTAAVRNIGGTVVGVGALCNRGGVTASALDVPDFFVLMNEQFPSYPEDDCPLCRTCVPVNTEVGKGKDFLLRKADPRPLSVTRDL